MSQTVHAAQALLPGGWANDVRITVADGAIAAVERGAAAQAGDERAALLIPGQGNLHSHAFQRAIAGRGEVRGTGEDSFWSWREVMYRFVARLDPEAMLAVAAMAYAEMLESGFTRVGEFHYLHNAPDGARYDAPAVMAEALACGTPILGLRRGAVPEVVEEGKNGFVRDSIEDLARCVSALPSIERMKCRQSPEDRFSQAVVGGRYAFTLHGTKYT